MKSVIEIQSIIDNATGTTCHHKFSQIPGYPVITDGVFALAEAAGCYWLLDAIGSHQLNKKLDRAFQVWRLKVNIETKRAVLQGYNDVPLVVTQKIPCTSFPLEYLMLYLVDGVILLPSEY